jgi:hypothetical protein
MVRLQQLLKGQSTDDNFAGAGAQAELYGA